MLNLIMDLYHIDATLTLFLLGITGAQYTILIKLVICAWQHWETITNGSHRKKSIWLSPFFLCTDQLQVHNNKHPPTQKKKLRTKQR